MNAAEFAALVDHTLLTPEATADAVLATAWEAAELGCASVCVNSSRLRLLAEQGPSEGLTVCTVLGFPLGAVPGAVKVAEAVQAKADYADEFDLVVNLGAVKDGDWVTVEREIRNVRYATEGHVLKVILETAALTDAEIVTGCQVSRDAGADFVKTSTGFHPAGGATVEAVALMAKTVPDLGVKASGGIRNLATALAMLNAGATRLGMGAAGSRAVLAELTGDTPVDVAGNY